MFSPSGREDNEHGVANVPNGFNKEQYKTLLRAFAITNMKGQSALNSVLHEMHTEFLVREQIDRGFGRWPAQRERLHDIAKSARLLRRHLSAEPLKGEILRLAFPELYKELGETELLRLFSAGLEDMEGCVTRIAENPNGRAQLVFRRWFPTAAISETRKSMERRIIWEPLIRLWMDLGHECNFSKDLLLAVTVVHGARRIAAPNAASVRQAFRDLKASVNGAGVQALRNRRQTPPTRPKDD
jgi:hypothetical protein